MIKVAVLPALVGAVLLLAGPLGSRFGGWSFGIGFVMLAAGALLGFVGAGLALLGGLRTGQWIAAAPGLAVGLTVVAIPATTVLRARGTPPIHDITTDFDDPPQFIALRRVRTGAVNPPEYDGPSAAEQQRRAYPDVRPLELTEGLEAVFERTLETAHELGWEIVMADPIDGRIEAVDTTFWFGFRDDIVIRLRRTSLGTRVDARSKSRVGVGDAGKNARRIEDFLEHLESRT